MNISAISASVPRVPPARAESAEGPGPDHDGDADDVQAATRVAGRTAPTPAPGRIDVYA